jgi:hypothetical protein
LAIGLAAMVIASPAAVAREDFVRATVANPATVPVTRTQVAHPRDEGPARVVITVTGYQPSPAGPVMIAASLRCGAEDREIGRFSVLSATGFTEADQSRKQYFGLPLPDGCGSAEHVIIRLVPGSGDGTGAHIDIGGVEIR